MRRVSILMPCRDAADHIDAAIASMREQTFTDFEVVAVDDGSADDTFARLYAWAQEDDRVRILSTHARGLVPALASALAAARGELVARMDADDIALPERLERQVALLDDDPRIAACGTGIEYFPEEAVRDGARRYERWINGLTSNQEIARDVFVECPIPHPTLVIRRHVLHAIGGYRELGWPEDYDLVLRLWSAGYRMAKVPDVLLRWRESPDRASRTDDRYAEIEFRRIKIYFLQHTLLAAGRAAVIAGAGPTGKVFARELVEAGTPVVAFVDVDPDRIGQAIHGAPVIPYDDLPAFLADYSDPRLEALAAARAAEAAGRAGGGADPSAGTAAAGEDPARDGADSVQRPLVLAAVGQEGAREEIRAALRRHGMVELEDFVAVA
jgi:GT2 family glycosyltransferase